MDALVVSIGEELLQGRVLDTNAKFLSEELLKLGFNVRQRITIGDQAGELRNLLKPLRGQAGLICCSGGLGPTVDDRVREELAELLGSPLVAQVELDNHYHQVQAMIPDGATALRNRSGTAWGFATSMGQGTYVMVLPGPPVECRNTFQDGGGRDYCERLAGNSDIAFGVFHTAGLPESQIGEKIKSLMGLDNPQLGINASAKRVSVSVLAKPRPGDQLTADQVLENAAVELKKSLGECLWGRDQQTLARVVVSELKRQGKSVASAESCTGGLLAAALTSVAGASEVFGYGWNTYSNDAKQSQLGLNDSVLEAHGAVSAECAIAMAQGARLKSGADWAVSATGIAGPSGGTEDKPVGLVFIGVAGPEHAYAVRRQQWTRGGRQAVQLQTVRDCLDALRRELLGLERLCERR